jgi:hypothetical protein
MKIESKNTKRLILSFISILFILGLIIGSSNIVSAAILPTGKINNLSATKEVHDNGTYIFINFNTANVGILPGYIWSKVYKQVGPGWNQIYSKQGWLSHGNSYSNYIMTTGSPIVLYTFKVQVGHSNTVDDTKYITK